MELLGLIEQIHTEELKPEVVVRLAQLQGDMLAPSAALTKRNRS